MAKQKDSLGDRMKKYENISRNYLTRRIPVIIRVDGKAFHTFTRGMNKPFDSVLMNTMKDTMKYMCENIQGCVFAYTQSDEITFVLADYATIKTDAWFGYNIQKMASVAASMATLAFNQFFIKNAEAALQYADTESSIEWSVDFDFSKYKKKFNTAMFDARVFSIPKDEVCNCLIWRQQDATRNSIESVGQANFSQKQLNGKSCNMIQEMLWSEKGINWNDFSIDCKRGTCCYRIAENTKVIDPSDDSKFLNVTRNVWVIDNEIPIFTQDRNFIERWI
jgi:tRNA(His) 5'-end guanylyltransferase